MDKPQDELARHLSDSIEDLHKQVEKVEFWASAIASFAQPVPGYDPEVNRIGRYLKPARRLRKRRHRRGTRAKPKGDGNGHTRIGMST